mmetsp:Transcript_3079/g.9395  ORF Transcript_3079/g.9395 Transcript_3079/m.9395 type:complete len:291 (+) Transcript_3079:162-1034(+)
MTDNVTGAMAGMSLAQQKMVEAGMEKNASATSTPEKKEKKEKLEKKSKSDRGEKSDKKEKKGRSAADKAEALCRLIDSEKQPKWEYRADEERLGDPQMRALRYTSASHLLQAFHEGKVAVGQQRPRRLADLEADYDEEVISKTKSLLKKQSEAYRKERGRRLHELVKGDVELERVDETNMEEMSGEQSLAAVGQSVLDTSVRTEDSDVYKEEFPDRDDSTKVASTSRGQSVYSRGDTQISVSSAVDRQDSAASRNSHGSVEPPQLSPSTTPQKKGVMGRLVSKSRSKASK